MDHFITRIDIEKLRHLQNISIELNSRKKMHLLLTGKNGSGKTTLLAAIKRYMCAVADERLESIVYGYPTAIRNAKKDLKMNLTETDRFRMKKSLADYKEGLKEYKDGIELEFSCIDGLEGLFKQGKFILAYYSADRKTGITRVTNAENVELSLFYGLDDKPADILLKYLIHMKTQQAYARNENDMETVEMLDAWFARFVNALKVLLDNDTIELKYDYKNYNFQILEEGREPYGLDQLSDGYSAAIRIVADLIMRMEQNWLRDGVLNSYSTEGIVLIDELETHLHIGLQRTILPFLTSFFPGIQFIVTTHSPYILNSINNCVIYDLEKKLRMEDLSGYSAEGIVEGYFEIDSYSENLMNKIKRYKELVELVEPTEDERAERGALLSELKQLSGDLSKEAKAAFDDIEDKRKRS